MEKEDTVKDEEQADASGTPSRAARIILQERMEKRHRKASMAKLISYIIALIAILLLMLWLKRGI